MDGAYRKEAGYRNARLEKKTRDYLFRYSLETEFEFSPRVSEGVLALVNDLYFDVRPLREGQIRYIAGSKEEGSGKRMEDLEKVEVILTQEAPWDEELVKEYVDLIKHAEGDEFKCRRLESLKEQLAWLRRAREVDFKKRPSSMVWGLI